MEKSRFAAEYELLFRVILEAGRILVDGKLPLHEISVKPDKSIVTAVDHRCALYLDAEIKRRFPADAILNEETFCLGQGDADWNRAERCWILDPLDSTSSYVNDGKHYGIIMGLTVGGEPQLGMTYKPEHEELYFAAKGEGARRMRVDLSGRSGPSEAVRVSSDAGLNLVLSKGRHSTSQTEILDKLGDPPHIRMNGSLKINEVARGEYSAFISPAGNPMSLWDLCATQVILEEAGGKMTDLSGNPIDYRDPDPVNALGLIASNRATHDFIVRRLSPG